MSGNDLEVGNPESWVRVTLFGPSQGDERVVAGCYVECSHCGKPERFFRPMLDAMPGAVADWSTSRLRTRETSPSTWRSTSVGRWDAGDAIDDVPGLRAFIPHLSHFRHWRKPRGYEDWMAIDLDWLSRCEVLLRLPGDSPGADREVAWAQEMGIPVYHSVEELVREMARAA